MYESSTDTVNAYNATLTADGDYANGRGNGWMPTDQTASIGWEKCSRTMRASSALRAAVWAIPCSRNHYSERRIPV